MANIINFPTPSSRRIPQFQIDAGATAIRDLVIALGASAEPMRGAGTNQQTRLRRGATGQIGSKGVLKFSIDERCELRKPLVFHRVFDEITAYHTAQNLERFGADRELAEEALTILHRAKHRMVGVIVDRFISQIWEFIPTGRINDVRGVPKLHDPHPVMSFITI